MDAIVSGVCNMDTAKSIRDGNMDLSVIIPSYKDPYLHKTIDDILLKFRTDYEIIPVCDGYIPKQPIIRHERVKPVYIKDNAGMRNAINIGVEAATGKYLMRTDEHCMFAEGFDSTILETIQDNWIVVGRRFFLNPVTWTLMDKPPIDYEKLEIITKPTGRIKFHGVEWKSRTRDRADVSIDETMAMQGSVWVMPRAWWDNVIGGLQSEGYGTHYQDSTEMLFKTWRAGGKLMLNKNTWYAHRHRSFPRTHNYPHALADKCFLYALNTWRKDYETVRQKWGV